MNPLPWGLCRKRGINQQLEQRMRPLIRAVSAIQLVESAPEIEKTGVNIKVLFPACTHNSNRAIYDCAFLCVTQHTADFLDLLKWKKRNHNLLMVLLHMVQISGQHQKWGSLSHLHSPPIHQEPVGQLVGVNLNTVEDRCKSESWYSKASVCTVTVCDRKAS